MNNHDGVTTQNNDNEERTFGLEQFELSVLEQMWLAVANDNTEFSHAIHRQIEIKRGN